MDILIKNGQKFLRDKSAFKGRRAYKWCQNNKRMNNKINMQYNQSQSSVKLFSNMPPIPSEATSQHKSGQSTKHQYYGDSTQGQKAKKTSPDTPHKTLQVSNQTPGHHPSTPFHAMHKHKSHI